MKTSKIEKVNKINQLDEILTRCEKNLKFYVTDWAPNGLSDLIVTDSNGEILAWVSDALFGPALSFKDRLGNFSASFYGESVGMVPYDDQNYDAILGGEISDICPLSETDRETVLARLAGSPVKSFESTAEDILKALAHSVKGVRS